MTAPYLDLLRDIRDNGTSHEDRTGVGTRRVFGRQIRFDLAKGFPLLTTKKLPLRVIAEELFWFLSGSTHVAPLQEAKVKIWNEWATPEKCAEFGRERGDLGPVYGHQWRNFGATECSGHPRRYFNDGVDQIAVLCKQLRHTPNSRRMILTGWDPRNCGEVALPPCHTLTQFVVRDGKLSAQLYQRSADVFLGVPFNIASYALLVHMLAHAADLDVGDFVHTFGDVHIYNNHFDQVEEQLSREPRELPILEIEPELGSMQEGDLPELPELLPHGRLLRIDWDRITLHGYNPHPRIKAPVAV